MFALVLAVVATTALTGCVGPSTIALKQWSDGDAPHVAPQEAPGWTQGQWWAFRASFPKSNVTLDVALVVDQETAEGYVLGTNRSSGFFGLPFAGNVSRELNPDVAGQTWRMFDFPLEAGQEWRHELFGHTATTRVSGEHLDVPGSGEDAGFLLEARAYGSRFARYTYSPDVGWFTRLQIWDPGTGEELLDARLLAHGDSWDEDYYVSVPLETVEARYPADLPGTSTFQVPRGFKRLTAIVAVSGTAGEFNARLMDPHGGAVAEATVHVTGFQSDQREVAAQSGTWTFEHTGAGKGMARLELYGVRQANHGAAGSDPAGGDASGLLEKAGLPTLDVASALIGAAGL